MDCHRFTMHVLGGSQFQITKHTQCHCHKRKQPLRCKIDISYTYPFCCLCSADVMQKQFDEYMNVLILRYKIWQHLAQQIMLVAKGNVCNGKVPKLGSEVHELLQAP